MENTMSRPVGNQKKKRLAVVTEFAIELEAFESKSPRTAETYSNEVQVFADWLAVNKPSESLDTATKETVKKYGREMFTRGLSASRRRVSLYALRAFYRWRMADGRVDADPTAGISIPKQAARKITPPSPAAVRKVMEAVLDAVATASTPRERSRRLVELLTLQLLRYTGLRVSELSDLAIADVRLDELTIYVRNGKGGKCREVGISARLAAFIAEYLREVRPSLPSDRYLLSNPYAFPGSKTYGRLDPRAIWSISATYGKRAGLSGGMNPHAWRHGFATALIKQGLDLESTRKALGHSDLKTTLIYVDLDQDTVNERVRGAFANEDEFYDPPAPVEGASEPPSAA